ncbi:MAG TPA: hypothetical protein VHO28_11555 [Ignavibacteriales bacterium]|nr:hypothetical protein [Ignavibacteriales bacterium]
MERSSKGTIRLTLSLLTAVLVMAASSAGIFVPYTYSRETLNWATQGAGQDIANLFFAGPALIIAAVLAYRGSRGAYYIWGGTLLYLVYTYAIYCFALHFNDLFLIYCSIFGLSFYLLAYFMLAESGKTDTSMFNLSKVPARPVGIYLIVIAVMFCALWLKDIVSAMLSGSVPPAIADTGLLSNPVHVMDLAVLLPGFVMTAMLLFRKSYIGLALAPVMLMFCALMNIAIGAAVILLGKKGFPSDASLAAIFGILTLISAGMLAWFLRSLKK